MNDQNTSNYPYWQKQTSDKPLYPDMLWSKPENKSLAGKLLIIGGGPSGFHDIVTAYESAINAGAGEVRILLPSSLESTIKNIFPEANFAPSTKFGGFRKNALATFLDLADWSDGVLLVGDIGKDSETILLIEDFIKKYQGSLMIAGNIIDNLRDRDQLLKMANLTLVFNKSQIQKFASKISNPLVFHLDDALMQVIEKIHSLSLVWVTKLVLIADSNVIVAINGEVSSTKFSNSKIQISNNSLIAKMALWQIQNKSQAFKALTTAIIDK